MKELFYREIKENIGVINNTKGCQKAEGDKLLVDTIVKMINISHIARHDGLLALEEEASNKLGDFPNGKALETMIMLVVDGTDPSILEEISELKYLSSGYVGYEALQYLMMLNAVLSIQAGENPLLIERRLLAMVPESIESQYREAVLEIEEKEVADRQKKNMEALLNSKLIVKADDDGYEIIKTVDYAFRMLDDISIQRTIKDIEVNDIDLAMKGLSGEANKKILNNVSERLALIMAEDAACMGTVRVRDIEMACKNILKMLIRLIDCGEVVTKEADTILAVNKVILNSPAEESPKKEKQNDSGMLTADEIRQLLMNMG